ncbi:MAG TPA: GNAT family protein [Ferruginibacter sp.]|nr:GNAT family protein [Ferruginibacter sp.]HMP20079.1 GNAT family protein [Ferruginibacter sp.]
MSTQPPAFFSSNIILENDRVRIEPLEEKHFEPLWLIAQNPNLWLFSSSVVQNKNHFRRYINTALTERDTFKSYPFVYTDKATGAYVGSTRYGNIDLANKRLEIGWTWLAQQLHATGFNRQCKFLLLCYGFETLHLNRIELKTSTLNIRSQKAMQHIGAVKEGILRRHSINEDGTIRDAVYFSFIKDEWPTTKAKYFSSLY